MSRAPREGSRDIERSGRALIEETMKLMPPGIAKASPQDQTAAARAERLAELEQQRAAADVPINEPASPPRSPQPGRPDELLPPGTASLSNSGPSL